MKGLEVIPCSRTWPETTNAQSSVQTVNAEVVDNKPDRVGQALDIAQDTVPRLIDLVQSYLEIKKIREMSDAQIAQMREMRKALLDEAEAYVMKKQADTNAVIDQMEEVRLMMQDFYAHSDGKMSGDAFCKVMTEIVKQMNNLGNGDK